MTKEQILEKIARLATLRGRKYMPPEAQVESDAICEELIAVGALVDVDRLAITGNVIGFNFDPANAIEYADVYLMGFSQQLSR